LGPYVLKSIVKQKSEAWAAMTKSKSASFLFHHGHPFSHLRYLILI